MVVMLIIQPSRSAERQIQRNAVFIKRLYNEHYYHY